MNLTNEDVQQILELLEASSYEELQLTTEQFKLTLRRGPSGDWTQDHQTRSVPRVAAAPAPQPPLGEAAPEGRERSGRPTSAAREPASATRSAAAAPPAGTPSAGTLIEIHPPLMGTFYRAPQPGAAPFVDVGSSVTPDTVIGIVETMKLMNSVYAGSGGVITEICAANGQLVEQHDVLMRLKPA